MANHRDNILWLDLNNRMFYVVQCQVPASKHFRLEGGFITENL